MPLPRQYLFHKGVYQQQETSQDTFKDDDSVKGQNIQNDMDPTQMLIAETAHPLLTHPPTKRQNSR